MSERPRVLFWPIGDETLETASSDAESALSNLSKSKLDVTAVEEMTWWKPTEIPRLANSIKNCDIDAIVIFAVTYYTALCIIAIVKRFKLPTVVWTTPTRYSLAASGLAVSYLRERGHWLRLLCNEPGDESVRSEIEQIARAAHALRKSESSRIGIIGRRSPLMVSLPYDLELLQKKLGPRTIEISIRSLDKALHRIRSTEVDAKVSELKEKFGIKVSDEILTKAVRFQLAVRKLVTQYHVEGIALECWTNLFLKYGVNPCLGHVDDLMVGCEGDVVNLCGSIILRNINGVNPYLTDLLAVDEKSNTIKLSHCSAPISLAKNASEVSLVGRTEHGKVDKVGKTVFLHFEFKNGPVTLARFYGRRLDRLYLASGELRSTGEYWGGIQLDVHSDNKVSRFLDHVSGNHYLVTYGDIRPELRLFAEWNDLEVLED